MSEYVKFLASKEVRKQLKNLQTFFGYSTQQKLFEQIVPYAIVKIASQPPPPNLTAEQKVAFQKLLVYHKDVCKSIGLLWPSLQEHIFVEEDEQE